MTEEELQKESIEGYIELVETYDEYISLLDVEITELVSIATVRGWKSPSERVLKGHDLRKRISDLKKQLKSK